MLLEIFIYEDLGIKIDYNDTSKSDVDSYIDNNYHSNNSYSNTNDNDTKKDNHNNNNDYKNLIDR